MKTYLLVFGGLIITALAATVLIPTAKITVHAIDEAGNNLSGIDVGITFDKLTSSSGSWGSTENGVSVQILA